MGVFESLGIDTSGLDTGAIWGAVGSFAGLIVLALITVGIFFAITYFKGQKNRFKVTLHWFETIQDRMVPIDDEKAEMMTIPQTTIRIFKTKGGKFLPAGTRPMGKSSYWLARTRTGEIIYFSLKDINKDMAEVGLDYDHGDARAMNENLRDLIQRAWTSKSQKWWQEYKEVISLAIIVFVMGLTVIFVLGKAEKVIASTEPVLKLNMEVLERIEKSMISLDNVCTNQRISVGSPVASGGLKDPGNQT